MWGVQPVRLLFTVHSISPENWGALVAGGLQCPVEEDTSSFVAPARRVPGFRAWRPKCSASEQASKHQIKMTASLSGSLHTDPNLRSFCSQSALAHFGVQDFWTACQQSETTTVVPNRVRLAGCGCRHKDHTTGLQSKNGVLLLDASAAPDTSEGPAGQKVTFKLCCS